MSSTEQYESLAARFTACPEYSGTVSLSEPLSRRTTMRVGGTAPLFLEPADEDSLVYALRTLDAAGACYFVLGGGSNVIISDAGFDCAVVSVRALHEVREEAGLVSGHAGMYMQAGASWARVTVLCKKRGLSGFEGFAGLPGTAGGALFMNASCFGLSACDNLRSVRYWADGAVREYALPEGGDARAALLAADWGYKRSPFQKPGADGKLPVLLSARFSCTALPCGAGEAERAAVVARYDETLRARAAKGHFAKPSAGSTFKNDAAHGIIAGKLIDDCGLKGLRVGGAQVASWHGNIVINAGGATASDIRALVGNVRETVRERTGVLLEPEVIFCGNWQPSN